MTTPEHTVAKALLDCAKRRGLFIRKCRWEGRAGAPDYIILAKGRAFFVETKARGEKPRKSQVAEFAKICETGCTVQVVDSAESAAQAVEVICT